MGVQLHPEATSEAVRLIIENEGDESKSGKYLQTVQTILRLGKPFEENAKVLSSPLDRLTEIEK